VSACVFNLPDDGIAIISDVAAKKDCVAMTA
jgi:hypothetical protein